MPPARTGPRPIKDQLRMGFGMLTKAGVMAKVANLQHDTAREAMAQSEVRIDDLHIADQVLMVGSDRTPIGGRFGTVYTASVALPGRSRQKVTIKQIRPNLDIHEEQNAIERMVREASILLSFGSKYVLNCLAVGVDNVGKPSMIILPYFEYNLKDFLIVNHPNATQASLITYENQLYMIHNIANGMQYLNNRGIVLKDFGCRSCLVAPPMYAFIGDVGGTERAGLEDYYSVQKAIAPLPIRWMAPEVLAVAVKSPQQWHEPLDGTKMHEVLTSAAEVWSLGVVIFEICTYAALPFANMSDSKFLAQMKKGNCTGFSSIGGEQVVGSEIVDLINWCLSFNPPERPSMTTLLSTIAAAMKEASTGVFQDQDRNLTSTGTPLDTSPDEWQRYVDPNNIKSKLNNAGAMMDKFKGPNTNVGRPRARSVEPLTLGSMQFPGPKLPPSPGPKVPPRPSMAAEMLMNGKSPPFTPGTPGYLLPESKRQSIVTPGYVTPDQPKGDLAAKKQKALMSDEILNILVDRLNTPEKVNLDAVRNSLLEASLSSNASSATSSTTSSLDRNETMEDLALGEINSNFQRKLKHACLNGNYDRVVSILSLPEINVNWTRPKGSGRTPLHCAAGAGHRNIVVRLLEARADPFLAAKDSTTPLNIAMKNKHQFVVDLLQDRMYNLQAGAENLLVDLSYRTRAMDGNESRSNSDNSRHHLNSYEKNHSGQSRISSPMPPSPLTLGETAEIPSHPPPTYPTNPKQNQVWTDEDDAFEVSNLESQSAFLGFAKSRGLPTTKSAMIREVASKGPPPRYQDVPAFRRSSEELVGPGKALKESCHNNVLPSRIEENFENTDENYGVVLSRISKNSPLDQPIIPSTSPTFIAEVDEHPYEVLRGRNGRIIKVNESFKPRNIQPMQPCRTSSNEVS